MIVIVVASQEGHEFAHRLGGILRERAGIEVVILEDDETADENALLSEYAIVVVVARPYPSRRIMRLLNQVRHERLETILCFVCHDPEDAYFYFRDFWPPWIFDRIPQSGLVSVIWGWPPHIERAVDLILRLLRGGEGRPTAGAGGRDSVGLGVPPIARTANMSLLTQQLPDATANHSATHFRVYHPACCRPQQWYTMMAYVHVPSVVEEVREHASRNFNAPPRESAAEEQLTIERGARITVVPESSSFRFNPQQASFDWEESWHVASFRFFPTSEAEGNTPSSATGRVVYYVGPVLVAEVPFEIEVGTRRDDDEQAYKVTESVALPFEAVFVSYSHRDSAIVDGLEEAYEVLGMEYLRDTLKLRSGDRWRDNLLDMIKDANIFQLCWSESAKRSPYIEEEWKHALTLKRERFIRPCYWELPMPDPPQELSDLHFAFFDLGPSRRMVREARGTLWNRLLNTFCWNRS